MLAVRLSRRLAFAAFVALVVGCAGADVEDDAEDAAGSATAVGWSSVGTGVSYLRAGDGPAVFVAYGGYGARDAWVRAWASELSRARLSELGVGHLYAVRGPSDPGYRGRELGNRALADHLARGAARDAPFVLVAAHSSGAFVAHELLGELRRGGLDADGAIRAKTVYANLDGGGSGLDASLVRSLRRVAFVYAVDPTLAAGRSANADAAESLAAAYGSAPVRLVVARSGCRSGARWCLHDLLVTTRPHDPDRYDLANDYTRFDGRPVQTGWVEALAPTLDELRGSGAR
jgi:hypothetical protein